MMRKALVSLYTMPHMLIIVQTTRIPNLQTAMDRRHFTDGTDATPSCSPQWHVPFYVSLQRLVYHTNIHSADREEMGSDGDVRTDRGTKKRDGQGQMIVHESPPDLSCRVSQNNGDYIPEFYKVVEKPS
jgi:hypothetical protein